MSDELVMDEYTEARREYLEALDAWQLWIDGSRGQPDYDRNRPLKLVLWGLADQVTGMLSTTGEEHSELQQEWTTDRSEAFQAELVPHLAIVEGKAEALVSVVESDAFLETLEMFDPQNEIVIGLLSTLISDLGKSYAGVAYIERALGYDSGSGEQPSAFLPALHLSRLEQGLGLAAPHPETTAEDRGTSTDDMIGWFLWGAGWTDKVLFKNVTKLHKARLDFLINTLPWLFRRAAMEASWMPTLGSLLTKVAAHWYGSAGIDFESDDLGTIALKIEDFVDDNLATVDGPAGSSLVSGASAWEFDTAEVLAYQKRLINGARVFVALVRTYSVLREKAGRDMSAEDFYAIAKATHGLASALSSLMDHWDPGARGTIPRLTWAVTDGFGVIFKRVSFFEDARRSAEGMFDAAADFDSMAMAGHAFGLASVVVPAGMMIGGVAAGPVGWGALGLSLTGMGVLYFANDDPLVTWLRRMHFGVGAKGRKALRPDQVAFRFREGEEATQLKRQIGRLIGMLYPSQTRVTLKLRDDVEQPRTFKKYLLSLDLIPTYPMPPGTKVNVRIVGAKNYEDATPWTFVPLGGEDNGNGPLTQGRSAIELPGADGATPKPVGGEMPMFSTEPMPFEMSNRKFNSAYVEIEWVLPPDAPLGYMAHQYGALALPETISVPIYSFKYLADIDLDD